MRHEFLPFSPPLIGEEEISEVVDTLRSNWITTGPKTKQFETEFSTYLNTRGSLALNSCTAGLHTALVTLGIGNGDEVITTPMTFAASVNVIEHVGATPVLVDVDPDTLNIDPQKIEAAVTSRTRAIIPVHYAGHPADLDPINQLADNHGLVVVEDAAHALPAKYKGRFIGSGDNPTAFSFYATKNLTTAEGGMLTGNHEFLEHARVVSLHGMSRDAWKRYDIGGSWRYDIVFPGFKYNMTDIQASLGLWQLRKLAMFHQRRQEVAKMYNEVFSDIDAFQIPGKRVDVEHAWHLYVLRLKPGVLQIGRDQFIEEIGQRNIGTSVHFIPIHTHPYYRKKYKFTPDDFPVANDSYLRMLSLPLNSCLANQDVEDVIDAVLDIAKVFKRCAA